MKRVLLAALLVGAFALSGCAVTDYPVVWDSRGADANAVMQSFYDKAYIIQTSQVATFWPDGSDELFQEVTQDWKGDQWLYTYSNYDASGTLWFQDITYCDPTRQSDCAIVRSWNPDLPNVYPHGDQGAGYNNVDDPFDGVIDPSCQGYRSLSMLLAMNSRLGECGSGIWSDKQGAAFEFANLERVNFRGSEYYHLPIDSSVASFAIQGQDGAATAMPVFGRFNGYLDERLRLLVPVTANAKYQMRWLSNWVANHGSYLDMDVTYGALSANFKINVTTFQNALDRL